MIAYITEFRNYGNIFLKPEITSQKQNTFFK